MSLTVNIYYTGSGGSARKFAEEMTSSGLVEAIRAEDIDAAVNLAGLEAGSHSCRIEIAQDAHQELTFEAEPAEVGVELTAVEAE